MKKSFCIITGKTFGLTQSLVVIIDSFSNIMEKYSLPPRSEPLDRKYLYLSDQLISYPQRPSSLLSKIQTFYQLTIGVFLICDISIIKTKDQTILNDWWLQLMSFISCNLIALQEICSPWLIGSFCLNLHNSSPGNFGDGGYRWADNPFFCR